MTVKCGECGKPKIDNIFKAVKRIKPETITPLKAYILMKKSKGLIFTVDFLKIDGSKRTMNCRLGVSKGLTGKGASYDPETREKLFVYDIQSKGYRTINLDSLLKLKLGGKTYRISRFA